MHVPYAAPAYFFRLESESPLPEAEFTRWHITKNHSKFCSVMTYLPFCPESSRNPIASGRARERSEMDQFNPMGALRDRKSFLQAIRNAKRIASGKKVSAACTSCRKRKVRCMDNDICYRCKNDFAISQRANSAHTENAPNLSSSIHSPTNELISLEPQSVEQQGKLEFSRSSGSGVLNFKRDSMPPRPIETVDQEIEKNGRRTSNRGQALPGYKILQDLDLAKHAIAVHPPPLMPGWPCLIAPPAPNAIPHLPSPRAVALLLGLLASPDDSPRRHGLPSAAPWPILGPGAAPWAVPTPPPPPPPPPPPTSWAAAIAPPRAPL